MNHNLKSDATLSYLAQFRVHQKFVQAHLKGTLNVEQPLPTAFSPPSSYWSSDEKDLFFHGLAAYSRFRPDLISESIKTKTVLDVCLYLDILQTASSSIPSEIHGSPTSSFEPAMEVSSAWIQNEESFAASLTQYDSCSWILESAEGETENPENPSRCVCSPQSLLVDYTPVDHSSHTELRNSYLSHLDCTCLLVLEKIVREAQLGEVDSVAVPLSPTPDSSRQLATQVEVDLDLRQSPAVVTEAPKPDSSKLGAEYLLMKRLYMRRKRVQSTGKSINMKAVRLPPGRQSRPKSNSYQKKRKIALSNSRRKESLREPGTVVDPDADHVVSVPTSVEEMDQEDESQSGPWSKKGLKKLPRMKNRFLEIGVNSQLASNNNLDFFHLSSLARLMRLYGSLNDSIGPTFEVSISADTIQLMVAILKEFISEVVRGSLISKEQEIRLKGTLKVWKYNQNEITVENVKETLKSMGITHSNLKDYFAKLVTDNNDISLSDPSIDTEMGVHGNDSNRNSAGHQCEDEDDASNEGNACKASDTSEEQSAKPSQAMTEMWLPQSLRRCLLPKYFRLSKNEDDDILPEIDLVELLRELKEEEELDVRDLLASREYEAELWSL